MNNDTVKLAEILIPDLKTPALPMADRAIRELRVRERARADGVDNVPPTDATVEGHLETEIIAKFQGGADALNAWADKQLNRATEGVLAVELTAEENDPQRVVPETLLKARSAIHDQRETVAKNKRHLDNARSEWVRFRRDNSITRKAVYPKSRVLAYYVICFIGLIEAVMNALCIAPNNPNGLLAAGAFSLLVATCNVATAWIAGHFCWRWAHHRDERWRVLAVIGILALAGIAFALQLFMAHYRFVLEALGPNDAADAGVNTLTSVRSDFWGFLQNIYAAGLFVAGLVGWAVCAVKAAGLDDAYPHYGAVDRVLRQAEGDYHQARKELRSTVMGIVQAGSNRIDAMVASAKAKFGALTNVLNRARALVAIGRDSVGAVSTAATTALRCCREENTAVRTTPAPAHFAYFPTLKFRFDSAPAAMISRLRAFDNEVAQVAQVASQAHARLHAEAEVLVQEALAAIEAADVLAEKWRREEHSVMTRQPEIAEALIEDAEDK